VNNNASHIYDAPLVISFGFWGASKHLKPCFPGKFLDVTFQTRKVRIACRGGNHKKISPKIQRPHIHYHNISAIMTGEEFGQLNCRFLVVFSFL
jgi:hypothetical protein